jgi:hypothetical protein
VVSVTPWPLYTPGKDPVLIVQEAGWAPGPIWTNAENLAPTGIRSPDRPARSQSLHRLSYPAHFTHIHLTEYSRSLVSDADSASGDMNSYNSQRTGSQLYRMDRGQTSFQKPSIMSVGFCWFSHSVYRNTAGRPAEYHDSLLPRLVIHHTRITND